MKESTNQILQELFIRYPQLEGQREAVCEAFRAVKEMFAAGGTLFTCGNGGSAADAEHIVGELVKSFRKKRAVDVDLVCRLQAMGEDGVRISRSLEGGVPCIALTSHPALSTAYANDREPVAVFAQQLSVFGKTGDMLIVISTSGNSQNCVYAAMVAKAMGIKTLALTGGQDSRLLQLADYTVKVPETETYKIQELHLPIYHALCAYVEEELF